MLIRSHTQIYVRDTFGIRRVRSKISDIHQCRLYAQRPISLDMFQRMRAYTCSIYIYIIIHVLFLLLLYVTQTLTIRKTYAGYAKYTPVMLGYFSVKAISRYGVKQSECFACKNVRKLLICTPFECFNIHSEYVRHTPCTLKRTLKRAIDDRL